VTVRVSDAPTPTVSVSDDGPRIPPEQKQRVFERFHRLLGSSDGSGLGLAIAQELAALYGGRLGLQPSPWGGLRAVLELPAAPPAAATASARRG